MDSRKSQTRATLLSFVLAIVLLSALLYIVGVADILAVLGAIDPVVVGVLSGVVLCWIGVWSGSLRIVLRVLDLPDPPVRTFLAYTSMMFWDNVTPFSTVAADPIAAGVLAETFDVEYERSLAIVITVDFLNFVPAPLFAIVGLLYVVATAVAGDIIGTIMIPLVAGLVLLTLVSYLSWQHRQLLGSAVVTAIARTTRMLGRIVPGIEAQERHELQWRMDTLLEQLETVATHRRALVFVLLLAVTGWAFLSLALWLSLYAVGVVIPPGVTLFAVPLVTVVELVPLPGGVGGLEPLLVLLLTPTTGGSLPAVTAGVLVFRLGTHWFPILLGGTAHPVLFSR